MCAVSSEFIARAVDDLRAATAGGTGEIWICRRSCHGAEGHPSDGGERFERTSTLCDFFPFRLLT